MTSEVSRIPKDDNDNTQGDTTQTPCGNSRDSVVIEEVSHISTSLDKEKGERFDFSQQPPFPSQSYTSSNGDFLHLFGANSKIGVPSIHCYSPWTVKDSDDCSLLASIEVDDDEKDFTLGVCGAQERVIGTFIQYFASGQTLHPMGTQEVRKFCICPWHRQAVLLDLLDNRIISCIQLPSAQFCRLRSEEKGKPIQSENVQTAPTGPDEWRVVIEHKGQGFIRFYDMERRKGCCYCDAPLSYFS
ncbi:uncharacterized protein TM35_000043280 [Trypanosoma theileri]|uniref:Uncharacterized protein n=1 Tax=Trypanosoma theileri TaxID=67003 RepID=A0A1X0P589_9TRYP|nr:uncharacterized protein TM35_000043280 [Trypanosoma theileri]ORC92114.1 hypothetical protein TM35_000043280 [Trypanosoma theileri]